MKLALRQKGYTHHMRETCNSYIPTITRPPTALKKTYTSKDFYFSGYLLANGLCLQSATGNKGKMFFTFTDSELAEKMSADYFGLKASISPIIYANALKTLKMIIHNNETTNEQFQSQIERAK